MIKMESKDKLVFNYKIMENMKWNFKKEYQILKFLDKLNPKMGIIMELFKNLCNFVQITRYKIHIMIFINIVTKHLVIKFGKNSIKNYKIIDFE